MHGQYSSTENGYRHCDKDGECRTFDRVAVLFHRETGAIYSHGEAARVTDAAHNLKRYMALTGQLQEVSKMTLVGGVIDAGEMNKIASQSGYVLAWYAREMFFLHAGRHPEPAGGGYSHAGCDVVFDDYELAAKHLYMAIIIDVMTGLSIPSHDWISAATVKRLEWVAKWHGGGKS